MQEKKIVTIRVVGEKTCSPAGKSEEKIVTIRVVGEKNLLSSIAVSLPTPEVAPVTTTVCHFYHFDDHHPHCLRQFAYHHIHHILHHHHLNHYHLHYCLHCHYHCHHCHPTWPASLPSLNQSAPLLFLTCTIMII